MRITQLIAVFLFTATLMTSCVSTKKFNAKDAELTKTKNDLNDCQTLAAKAQISSKKLNEQVKGLQSEVDSITQADAAAKAAAANNNGSDLISALKNMNVISDAQAQSVQQSLQSIAASGSSKDALNANLVSNIKSSLGVSNDSDITVQSDKGFLYIDLTDHMFFNSGSADLTKHAKDVVAKIAKMLESYPDMKFMVVGHTDSEPIRTACIPDNWDLSIRRATALVRVLQREYKIDPKRMLAAGHGEYEPIAANDTPAHRSQNRRISLVMMPQMDEFLKLMVKK
jgi:chemotaxis protein MotB